MLLKGYKYENFYSVVQTLSLPTVKEKQGNFLGNTSAWTEVVSNSER